MWTMSQIFTSLWASLLTLFAKRITSISSGVLNTRLQRQKVVCYKEMCAMRIINVIFQRKNKKALWFPVFLGQGTSFVSVVLKGFYFQYSNFELYSYFSSSETKFQHTSIEATCNTRTLFRNKQKLSLSIPVTVRSMQITKKKTQKEKTSCTVKYLWRNHGKIQTMFLHRSDPIFQSNVYS